MDIKKIIQLFTACLEADALLIAGFLYLAPLSNAATIEINDGDTIRMTGTQDVYIVKIVPSTGSGQAKKFKRLILNPQIFNSYGQLSWGKIKDVDKATMDQFTNSNLAIHVNANGSVADPRVWSITSAPNSDRGIKKWLNIIAEQLIKSGIDQSSVYNINDLEAGESFYDTATPLTASDDLIGWATNVNGAADSSAGTAHQVTVSGKITDDKSGAMSSIILTCNGKTLATTNSSGAYAFQLNIGDEYCIRVSNPPGNSYVHAIQNRLNSNYNSYEYQIAGRGPISTDNTFEQGADRNTDSGMDFTIFVQTTVLSSQTPSITNILPASVTAGGGDFTLDINGTNFNGFSNIIWGGSAALSTQFLSITHLAATVPASFTASGANVSISVNNSSGGTSGSQTLTINNPVPSITGISPASLASSSGAFTLTVNGTNFTPTSIILWKGSTRTIIFVSSSKLTAQISASDIASAGTAQVTVSNPTPGGGTSAAQTFTITQS